MKKLFLSLSFVFAAAALNAQTYLPNQVKIKVKECATFDKQGGTSNKETVEYSDNAALLKFKVTYVIDFESMKFNICNRNMICTSFDIADIEVQDDRINLTLSEFGGVVSFRIEGGLFVFGYDAMGTRNVTVGVDFKQKCE